MLLDYAQRLLALADEAREAVRDGSPRGALVLGAMESTSAVRLPGPLSDFVRLYPEVKLALKTGNPQQLAAAVLAGTIDAALVTGPIVDGPFEREPVYQRGTGDRGERRPRRHHHRGRRAAAQHRRLRARLPAPGAA